MAGRIKNKRVIHRNLEIGLDFWSLVTDDHSYSERIKTMSIRKKRACVACSKIFDSVGQFTCTKCRDSNQRKPLRAASIY